MAGKLKKLTNEQVIESIKLYRSGFSLSQVAARFPVTRQSMHDLLKRRIKLRKQVRYGKANNFYTGTKANDYAQNVLEKAVQSGKIIRPKKCESCGGATKYKNNRAGVDAHHCDYNKPLQVMWLCRKCHYAWHRINKPIPRRCKPAKHSLD